MYLCSKKQATYKEYSCFDFPARSMLHLMYAEVAWVLVYSGTQVQSKIILDPDYLPDYPSVSYDFGHIYVQNGSLYPMLQSCCIY